MARLAERFENDPVIVLIEDDEPTMTFDGLDVLATDEPVDLGTSAAELLREAREAGEV